jgi:TolB-like protein
MAANQDPLAAQTRLDSWKEIAAFFGRDERTVKRWEKERGLPVHRVPGAARGTVFAYSGELTRWLQGEGGTPSDPDMIRVAGPVPAAASTSQSVGPDVTSTTVKAADTSFVGRWRLLLWTLPVLLVAGFFLATSFNHREVRYKNALAAVHQPVPASTEELYLGPDSVAVLPFTNGRGDITTEYLSDGITESLMSNLAHIPRIKVRSRDSVFRYKGKDVDVRTAGSELGVPVVVSGRVTLHGDSIDISTELTDVRDNTEIWGQRYTGKRADIVSLQERMAGDVAGRLRASLSSAEKQEIVKQGTQDPEAYALYLKGRYEWNNRSFTRLNTAISYFNQAIAKDPEYALAYSGIADAYSVLPNFGGNPNEDASKSNAAARKALELDSTLAHTHAVLGNNEMQYDWDFAAGEAEFKKAIELDPNDATAHQWYAENLGTIGGREQEALAEIDRAHELDPQSRIITRVKGSVLVSAHRFDDAIAICKKLENDDPAFALPHDCLAWAYWGKRTYPQMVEEKNAYGQLSGARRDAELGEALEHGLRSGGWQGALTQAAANLEARRKTGYDSPVQIARFYADLGDKELTFQWLDTAYREHDWLLEGLNTYCQFDNLHPDARFAELVKKVGLPAR